MSQQFVYEYVFEAGGSEILAHVSYAFYEISELESISTFPHRERREFATAMMAKYAENHYQKLEPSDITCAFAKRLNELFENELTVYWTRKFRVTMIFFTGFSLNFTRVISTKVHFTTVRQRTFLVLIISWSDNNSTVYQTRNKSYFRQRPQRTTDNCNSRIQCELTLFAVPFLTVKPCAFY